LSVQFLLNLVHRYVATFYEVFPRIFGETWNIIQPSLPFAFSQLCYGKGLVHPYYFG